jgi:hypothetical protein
MERERKQEREGVYVLERGEDCVCVRERDRGTVRERERERERD